MNEAFMYGFADELEKIGVHSETFGGAIGQDLGRETAQVVRVAKRAGRAFKASSRKVGRAVTRAASAPGRALKAGISGAKAGYRAEANKPGSGTNVTKGWQSGPMSGTP